MYFKIIKTLEPENTEKYHLQNETDSERANTDKFIKFTMHFGLNNFSLKYKPIDSKKLKPIKKK